MYTTQFNRITHRTEIMGGKACVRGLRVTVGMIVNQVSAGLTFDEILNDYPYLERDDIVQSLQYSARLAEERELMLEAA